jgi:hypothetical protein
MRSPRSACGCAHEHRELVVEAFGRGVQVEHAPAEGL